MDYFQDVIVRLLLPSGEEKFKYGDYEKMSEKTGVSKEMLSRIIIAKKVKEDIKYPQKT